MKNYTFKLILIVVLFLFSGFLFVPKTEAAISFRASTTGTINGGSTLTINKPTGTAQNDVMVAAITINPNGGSTVTFTPPSGWTQVQSLSNRSGTYWPNTAMFYKVAGASEGTSYSWTSSAGTNYGGGWIASFSGANPSNPIDTSNIQTIGTTSSKTTSYSTPSITTAAANEMLVMTYGGNTTSSQDTWSTPSGASAISTSIWFSGTVTSSSGFYMLQSSAGATGSIASTATVSSYGNAGILALVVGSSMPTITSPTKTSIAGTSVTLGGNVTADGGATITSRGVCVGTSANPTTSTGTCFTTSGTTGTFTVNATGLSTSTNYHYTAYATNSVGTTYTTDDTFTTTANANYLAFGDQTVYSSVGTVGNSMRLLRVNVTTAGYLNSISPCFGVSSGTSTFYAGLYSDNSGSPGTLLTGPVSTTDSTTSLHFDTISTSQIYLSTGYYWIGETSSNSFDNVCNGGSGSYYIYNLGSGNAGNWPSTISGGSTSSYALGVYMTVDTTPRPLGVTANTATNVNSYYVTLNGSANPNGTATTGHFRIFTSQPTDCSSDSGGTRVPQLSSGDSSLGSGSTSQNFAYTTTFANSGYLTPQTQYWYCSYGVYTSTSQTAGSSTVATFTTPDGPANPCDASTTGNLVIPASASCSFSGTGYTGVSSTSSITFSAGSVMTVNPGQTIARGSSMVFSGGTLTLGGGSLVRGGVYAKDADGDGVVDDNPITDGYVGTSPPAGYVAWSTLGSSYNYSTKVRAISTYDCNPNNANVWQNVPSLVTDADHDGYQTAAAAATQCVGGTSVINGRTYYKDTAGNYTWMDAGSALEGGITDCNDNSATICPAGAVTSAVSNIANMSVTFNGSFYTYGGTSDQYWFNYGTTNTGNCSTLTSSTTKTSYTVYGSESFNQPSGLSPNTVYYYCAVASNSSGTGYGSISSFTTTNTTCYQDKDGDGYGNPNVTAPCGTAGYVTDNTDCYDNNSNAHPGQTAYFGVNRGDGSFDYNCDGVITKNSANYGYRIMSSATSNYNICARYYIDSSTGTCVAVNPSCSGNSGVWGGGDGGVTSSSTACGTGYLGSYIYSNSSCTTIFSTNVIASSLLNLSCN